MQLDVQNGEAVGINLAFAISPIESSFYYRFEFISDDTPSAIGVSPGRTSAVGTLSINCIETRQNIGVGVNLARIESPNLIIDWRR